MKERQRFECILAFVMSIGFQLTHKATCGGGRGLTRHSHYVRVRLSGLHIWRVQCTIIMELNNPIPDFLSLQVLS